MRFHSVSIYSEIGGLTVTQTKRTPITLHHHTGPYLQGHILHYIITSVFIYKNRHYTT
jgi:hypothetical protein